jgi:hypothetical protein
MGFPYNEASWSVVDGAMFMGWGSAAPGFYTLIAAVICTAALVYGHKSEAKKTKAYTK